MPKDKDNPQVIGRYQKNGTREKWCRCVYPIGSRIRTRTKVGLGKKI